ncbi:MAG: SCP2 sterol-binding domain-containing protein [Phycisphaerales bacterium]
MVARRSKAQSDFAKQFEDDALLSDFARPFPDLLGEKRTAISGSFKRIAVALGKSKRISSIQFTIFEGRKTRRWCLALTPCGCEVTEAAMERPDLEILTDAKSWADIAGGKVAPLEAFGQGKIRLRGDVQLARMLVRSVKR